MTEFEKQVLSSVDNAAMWKHVEYLCALDKTSGTDGERKAIDYVVQTLQSYGIDVNVYSMNAYLSYPVAASLHVYGLGSIPAKTRAFSETTPPEGAYGEIIYVQGGADMFTDTETVERLRVLDLRGKIVLSEGGGRDNMLLARKLGAVGYIHMWPSDEDVIHEGIVTPVWGTPIPETADSTPKIPVISIKKNDGLAIRARMAEGAVFVRLHTTVDTGWKMLMLPEAVIPGESPEYVLIGGHLDSWHLGATDNVTGNAVCLELARVFKAFQKNLQRGVRIAWWPGHSTGRYAGSTWYCDKFWHDIHENCVTYINIDSPGVLGAYDYGDVTSVAENDAFMVDIVREVTGQVPRPERPTRAGDQSFWGPGVTSLFMLLSNRPTGQRAQVGGSGMGWWWHTEQDTIDKIEPGVLHKDTQIYALAVSRLCTAGVLPLDISAQAREIHDEIQKIAVACTRAIDLTPAVSAARALVSVADRFQSRVAAADKACAEAGGACAEAGVACAEADGGCDEAEAACAEADGGCDEAVPADAETASAEAPCRKASLGFAMLRAVKVLTPVRYSPVEPWDHGPATPTKPIPMLQPALRLTKLEPTSDEFGFLHTSLLRKQNSVVHKLHQAARMLRDAMREK